MKTIIELAKDWIELQKLPEDSVEAQALEWTLVEVHRLLHQSPQKCLDFVLEVLRQTDDDWVLTNLAAGPLESMLGRYPAEGITLLESEVPRNSKLKRILGSVWQNLMPEEAWHRLQRLK